MIFTYILGHTFGSAFKLDDLAIESMLDTVDISDSVSNPGYRSDFSVTYCKIKVLNFAAEHADDLAGFSVSGLPA